MFFSPQMTQTKRRKRNLKKKEEEEDSAGRRRWFCHRFLAAGKQHIISCEYNLTCLGESLTVFAYALPTFRLRGAYAGELLYFQILAMQTSRLETLQKRERNSSISFCFSAKQLLSSNYLCFLDSGNFACCIELHSLDPSFLTHRLHNSLTLRSPTQRLP